MNKIIGMLNEHIQCSAVTSIQMDHHSSVFWWWVY